MCNISINIECLTTKVLERIKEPLKSLIGRDDPAVGYAVLAHMLLLVQRAPVIFEADHATFYCRTHDPRWGIYQRRVSQGGVLRGD